MGKNEGEVWKGEGEGVQGRGGRMIPGKAEGRVSGEGWGEKVVPGEGERGLGERVPGKGVGGTVVLGEGGVGGVHGKGVQARGLWNSSEIVSSGRAEDVGFELLLERVMGGDFT